MNGYQRIADMTYAYNADIGLSYSSPARGVWNIVHIGTLVPQSHQIFVCPTSCLRGVVLTTAELGAMDRMSTITVGEDNILEGDMEEALYSGVVKILSRLPERPRMVMVFTSCIHHFLAVNYQRVYRILRKEYPDIDFIDCYMDPIMRRTAPPDPTLRRQITRVIRPLPKDAKSVNIIGNEFRTGEHSDLYMHLVSSGMTVRDITRCDTYDEYLQMGCSAANITFHKPAAKAGKDLEVRLGQTWLPVRTTYDYDVIDADMKRVCETLGIPAPAEETVQEERRRTEELAEEVRTLLGDTPVSVDYTAVDEPLMFTLWLHEHGFRVESCFIENFTEDRAVFDALQKKLPDLRVYSSLNWNMRTVDRGHEGVITAVGQKAAYFNDTNHFVDVVESGDMYGYRGIRRMLELIREAYLEEKDMRTLVQIKGWGCHCG